MSSQDQIDQLRTNLKNAYVAVQDKQGVVPEWKNFDNLAEAISSIPSAEEIESDIAQKLDAINGESI